MSTDDLFTTELGEDGHFTRYTFSLDFVQTDPPLAKAEGNGHDKRSNTLDVQEDAIHTAAEHLEELIRGDLAFRSILAGSGVRILLTGLSK